MTRAFRLSAGPAAAALALGLLVSQAYAFNPQPDPPAKSARSAKVNNLNNLTPGNKTGRQLPSVQRSTLGGGKQSVQPRPVRPQLNNLRGQ